MNVTRNIKAIPILMYHSLSIPSPDEVMRSIHVRPHSFSRQMKLLKTLGYRGVGLTELEPYLLGLKTGKVVGITFDDGYSNNLKFAAPILAKYGFGATCYVVSSAIGSSNYWDRGLGIPHNPIMDNHELREWKRLGFELGCHTDTHKDLNSLDPKQQEFEILTGKQKLEDILGMPVTDFCYPYGRYSQTTVRIVQSLEFRTATTMKRGRVTNNDHLLELPRIPITFHTLSHLFLLKILTRYEDRRKIN